MPLPSARPAAARRFGRASLGLALIAAAGAASVGAFPVSSMRPAAASAAPVDDVDEIHASFGDDAATSMIVAWHGDATGFAFGTDTSYGTSALPQANAITPVDTGGPFEHVSLTGLRPGTVYHYSIDGGPDHEFETAPAGDFTWDDIGDTSSTFDSGGAAGTGCNSYWMSEVWQQIAAEQPDFVSHGGDISYANECGVGAVHQFFQDIEPVATMRAWEQSWGNHEYGSPTKNSPPGTPRDSMANYKGRLFLPNPQTVPNDTATHTANPGCPSPTDPTRNGCMGDDWGWYQVGHVLVIEYPEPWYNAQTAWQPAADALMARAENDPDVWFIVTTGHRPAYSAVTGQVDTTMTTALDALGDKYSPSARPDGKYVLNIGHHVHGGEVFAPQHGIVQITNGGGGTEESQLSPGALAPGELFRTGHFEHLHITVTGGLMRIDMICGPGGPDPAQDACTPGAVLYSITVTSPVAAPSLPASTTDNPTTTDTATPTTTDSSSATATDSSSATATDSSSATATDSSSATATDSSSATAGSTPPPSESSTASAPPQPKQWVGNPGIDGGDQTGWTGIYNSYSRVGTAQDAAGNWLLRVSTTSSTARPAGVNNVKPVWVDNASTAGMTYTAGARVRPSVAGEKAYLLLRETTASGAAVGSAHGPAVALTDTGALSDLPSVAYTAVNSGDSIRYSVVVTNLSRDQVLYVDDLSLSSPS